MIDKQKFIRAIQEHSAHVDGTNVHEWFVESGLDDSDEPWEAVLERVQTLLDKNEDVEDRTLEPVVMWLDGFLAGLRYAS